MPECVGKCLGASFRSRCLKSEPLDRANFSWLKRTEKERERERERERMAKEVCRDYPESWANERQLVARRLFMELGPNELEITQFVT